MIEYRLNEQAKKIINLETHIEKLEHDAATREIQRQSAEKRQLMAGVSFLGAIVLTLFGVIWSYRSVIFRGTQ